MPTEVVGNYWVKNKGKANKFQHNRFLLPNNSTMIIIYHFGANIQQYANLGRGNRFPSIHSCKNCPYEGKLYRHGFYERGVIAPPDQVKQFIIDAKKIIFAGLYGLHRQKDGVSDMCMLYGGRTKRRSRQS